MNQVQTIFLCWLTIVVAEKACKTDTDCGKTAFCWDNQCLKYKKLGESCGGFTATPQRCEPSLYCVPSNRTDIADIPGKCGKPCPKDLRICPDGSHVVRDPLNNCKFPPCPQTCPKDKPRVECYVNPCKVSKCPGNEYAECQPDYCGGCNAKWYLGGKEVKCKAPNCTAVLCAKPDCLNAWTPSGTCCPVCPDCSAVACPKCFGTKYPYPGACCPICGSQPEPKEEKCPASKPRVNCKVNPCTVSTCPSYPKATCQPDYCGGCFTKWFVDGKEVKCGAPDCTAVKCKEADCPNKYKPEGACCEQCPDCDGINCPLCIGTWHPGVCCPECGGNGTKPCPEDLRICDDGSSVVRDPNNNCQFPPCPECPKDKPRVFCFVDPCTVSKCPGHPKATCQANYCGGCNTRWFEGEKEIKCDAPSCELVDCKPPKCTNTYKPDGTCCPVCPSPCEGVMCNMRFCEGQTTPPGACCPTCPSQANETAPCPNEVATCDYGKIVERDATKKCQFPCPVTCPPPKPKNCGIVAPCFQGKKCGGHPGAVCKTSVCEACTEYWFENGKQVKCDTGSLLETQVEMRKKFRD